MCSSGHGKPCCPNWLRPDPRRVDTFHHQLARIAFDAAADLGLILAGGYAIRAHGLTSRPSRDLDFVTRSSLPLAEVTERLAAVYRTADFSTRIIESAPTASRFEVTDGARTCEIDLLKEGVGDPVILGIGPVLNRDDAVGLKVGALHDRAAHRDFIDIHAAHIRGGYALRDLERLGAAHLGDFSLHDLLFKLDGITFLDDSTFGEYGLTENDIAVLHRWAQTWAEDLRARLTNGDTSGAAGQDRVDWDDYLNE
jgi:hypothetical protein